MIAAVDTDALLELIWVAPVATSFVFSRFIVSVTRASDARRADRPRLAGLCAVMSVVTTAILLGGVALAVSVIAAK